jgi:hypothetical protein
MDMSSDQAQAKGLTKVIYQALEAVKLEVVAEGEGWSSQLLDQVEREVRSQMAPPDGEAGAVLFDLVFQRSFAEAADLFLSSLPPRLLARNDNQDAANKA